MRSKAHLICSEFPTIGRNYSRPWTHAVHFFQALERCSHALPARRFDPLGAAAVRFPATPVKRSYIGFSKDWKDVSRWILEFILFLWPFGSVRLSRHFPMIGTFSVHFSNVWNPCWIEFFTRSHEDSPHCGSGP